jgi:hypothetical protein
MSISGSVGTIGDFFSIDRDLLSSYGQVSMFGMFVRKKGVFHDLTQFSASYLRIRRLGV